MYVYAHVCVCSMYIHVMFISIHLCRPFLRFGIGGHRFEPCKSHYFLCLFALIKINELKKMNTVLIYESVLS